MAPKRRSNKTCVFANCKSDARRPDCAAVQFFPFPQPCMMYRNDQIALVCGSVIPKQQPHQTSSCAACSKSLKWIQLSRRLDGHFSTRTNASVERFKRSLQENYQQSDTIQQMTQIVRVRREELVQ